MQRRNLTAASIVEAFYGYVKKAWNYGREEKSINFETFEKGTEVFNDVSTEALFKVKAPHTEWEEIAEVDLEKIASATYQQTQLSAAVSPSSAASDVQPFASDYSSHSSSLETGVAASVEPEETSVSVNVIKPKFAHSIDFNEVNARLSSRMPELVQHVFKGQHLQIRTNTIRVGKKGSIVINVAGEKQGQWYNFEEGVGGNALIFLTHHLNMTPKDAALYASSFIGDLPERTLDTPTLKPQEFSKDTSETPTWTPVFPVPASKANPDLESNSHLNYVFKNDAVETMRFAYLDENKNLLGYVVRIEDLEGNKQTLPLTYCQNEKGHTFWKWHGFGEDRPLYGLDKLADHPDKPVLIVEGEKAADAAQKLFSEHVVVTWLGGTGGVRKANFEPLAGKDVTIWPDNDEAGLKAAAEIKNILGHLNERATITPSVSAEIIDIPRDRLPQKWDLADPLPEGITLPEIQSYVMKRNNALAATSNNLHKLEQDDSAINPDLNIPVKKSPEPNLLEQYIMLKGKKEALPFITKCSFDQKQDFVNLGRQMESLAMKISDDPELMKKAATKNVAKQIQTAAQIGKDEIARDLRQQQNSEKKDQSKRPEEDLLEMFIQLSKQKEDLPYLTRCTPQQKLDYVSSSLQMEKVAAKIEKSPELMEKAVSQGIEKQIKSCALMHRETQHRSKMRSHDRGRGMSYF